MVSQLLSGVFLLQSVEREKILTSAWQRGGRYSRYDQLQSLAKGEGFPPKLVDLELMRKMRHRVQQSVELQFYCLVPLLWNHLPYTTPQSVRLWERKIV